ncbi:MAG TPA: hypothetical protein VHE59_14165 [Mucilaginibacter sp.]|nr:hypothetical protein [Mucilaginibacter sp.]
MDVLAGAKKDKLSAILRDWYISDLKLKNVHVLKDNSDTTILNGIGSLTGMYTFTVAGYLGQMNYSVYFKVQIVCLKETYKVVLDNFQFNLSDQNLPIEDFFKLNLSGQKQDANTALADLYKMYSEQLYDMNASVNSSLKRLSRRVEKAKNKGKLN